jgi:hypothetical protein
VTQPTLLQYHSTDEPLRHADHDCTTTGAVNLSCRDWHLNQQEKSKRFFKTQNACSRVRLLLQLYSDLEVDRELERGLPVGMLNISRKIRPVCANLGSSMTNSALNFVKAYVSDDSFPQQAQQAGPRRAEAPKTPQEIAMSESVGDSPVNGLRHRGADGQASSATEPTAGQAEILKDR